MIESERNGKAEGWTQRISHLEGIIKQLESLETISGSKTLEDLVPGFK